MVKQGILHDYDLMANAEPSARGNTCIICGASPVTYQWSDYSGEGMCTQCGFPYQLKWGSEQQQAEGKYPYPNIQERFIPVLKEYWDEKHTFTCFGTMLGATPGVREFNRWFEAKHPEMIEKE